ncbi:MAG: C10 family peptidase [Bacteroidales bacterium]|nr:C10 family peptidase [Bacteroidales bacterium]
MKKLLKFQLFMIAAILLFSCEKNDFTLDESNQNLVSISDAKIIAEQIGLSGKSTLKSKGVQRRISDIDVVYDNEQPMYYIINFDKNSGFIILSADRRCMPILAFSETGSFIKEDAFGGLADWMERTVDYIEIMKADTAKLISFNRKLWEELDMQKAPDPELDPIDPENPPETGPVITEIGPLLTTEWGQGCDFNAQCPIAPDGPCGHAFAGCPTIAVAQIMRYKEHPSSYNWGTMLNTASTNETARLIWDIGDAIGVQWGGDGTGLEPREQEENIPSALRNTFGYSSSVQYIDYFGNHDRVVQELKWRCPVYMRGGEKKYWAGLIPYYGGGHAWVCDGYRQYQYPTHSYLYLHMNWGWRGISNGFFAFNNFNPMLNGERQDYNYKVGCIVGIRP